MQERTFRRLLRSVLPPFTVAACRAASRLLRPPQLFDGDDQLFLKAIGTAAVYGEYGCGRSTVWVAQNTTLPILSVDTSRQWIDRVMRQSGSSASRIRLELVDVGELDDWGRPLSFAKRQNFRSYLTAPWDKDIHPDLVLIDGRFRVACFFTSLLHAAPGSVILFDDYTDRPQYHVVEEIVTPVETFGRQAWFEVPDVLPRMQIQGLADKFEYVID